MAAVGPGTSWIIDITKQKARRRLEDAARRNAPNWNASGRSARDVLADQRAGAHNQAEMESRLLTPAYDVSPPVDPAAEAAASAGAGLNTCQSTPRAMITATPQDIFFLSIFIYVSLL